MKFSVFLLTMAFPAFLVAGCVTTQDRHRRDLVKIYNDLNNLDTRVHRLEEQLDDINEAQQRIFTDLDSLRQDVGRENAALAKRLDKAEEDLAGAEIARRKIADQVITELSGNISAMMKTHLAAGGGRVKRGREHVVRKGETLSEIAKAYGVTVKVIVEANNLSDPDSIRNGRKLFIPE
ncbi:MAG: LysM peptidoglycan-binding domain-containing protein [Kiritimatiellia bacterium]